MIAIDRYKWVAAVRILPGWILLVLALHGVSAFGEEIPGRQPPVPETVTPADAATPADNGYVDRSHDYIDQEMNEGSFGSTLSSSTTRPDTLR